MASLLKYKDNPADFISRADVWSLLVILGHNGMEVVKILEHYLQKNNVQSLLYLNWLFWSSLTLKDGEAVNVVAWTYRFITNAKPGSAT